MPFLGKSDVERRVLFNSIGPFWDGNEVWLIAAGSAMFAAFPGWYATLFSALYLPITLLLLALILRGVAFELRSQDERRRWRSFWDSAFFAGSALAAFIWGLIFGNLIHGLPIDVYGDFTGTVWDLLSPIALLTGVTFLLLFAQHGALYLALKTRAPLAQRAQAVAARLLLPTWLLSSAMIVWTVILTGMFAPLTSAGVLMSVLLTSMIWLLARHFLRTDQAQRAFVTSGVILTLVSLTFFGGLFPRLIPSTLDPAWSLTLSNSAASDYPLKLMTLVAALCLPLVILYQIWAYRILRGRIGTEDKLRY